MGKITRYRGDTYAIEVVLRKDGELLDMMPGNYTASFSYARGSKRTTIPGINGTVNGEVSFPFPAHITVGEFKYDIQVTSASGEIRTYIKDTLLIVGDVTK